MTFSVTPTKRWREEVRVEDNVIEKEKEVGI
jgi:hypothetical protein